MYRQPSPYDTARIAILWAIGILFLFVAGAVIRGFFDAYDHKHCSSVPQSRLTSLVIHSPAYRFGCFLGEAPSN